MIISQKINQEKPHASDILNSENGKIYLSLLNRKELKVLDIGCRVPFPLILCYHNFDTALLMGIDKAKDEKSCILSCVAHLREERKFDQALLMDACNSFFDFYRTILPSNINVKGSKRDEIINKEEFQKVITNNCKFSTNIEDFVIHNVELFDVIICYNLLHFTEQSEKILTNIKKFLKRDGIIIIRVENKNGFDKEFFIEELNENFKNGYLYETSKAGEWYGLTFSNWEIEDME